MLRGNPACKICNGTGVPTDKRSEYCDCLFYDDPQRPDMTWEALREGDVRLVFQCTEEDCEYREYGYVFPCDVQRCGGPVCPECDIDMEYVRTELLARDIADSD